MKHESKARIVSPHFGDNSHNEAFINLFTLQLVNEEVIDARLHHVEDEEYSVDFLSKEEMHQMTQEDY